MSRLSMYRRLVLAALFRHGSRAPVSVLSVAICAALLSALIGVSRDIPRQMGRELRSYGANLAIGTGGDTQPFTEGDLERALRSVLPERLVGAVPFLYTRVIVRERSLTLAGTRFEEARRVNPTWRVTGRWPDRGEAGLLVGAEVAELLALRPGGAIAVWGEAGSGEMTLAVDGILVTGGPEEGLVYADLGVARELSGSSERLDVALVSVQAQGEALESLVRELERASGGATVQPVKSVTRSEDLVLSRLGALVSVTTIVILLLTVVSLATTTVAVVVQRRTEIGLKRALGAGRGGIVLEFLGEAAALGLVGGLLGTGLGYLLARVMSRSVFARDIAFHPAIALAALGIALTVSVAACILPAARASGTEPAPVLRGE